MPWMGLEPATFTLRDKHQNLSVLLVYWSACLPLSLKAVDSGPIHSVL